jgi:hypothetical protein
MRHPDERDHHGHHEDQVSDTSVSPRGAVFASGSTDSSTSWDALPSSTPGTLPHRMGRVIAIAVALAALGLVPWMIYLGLTLPRSYEASQWSLLWIGFDVIECAVLALIAWMTWRRRAMVGALALTAGTLLFCDAWFDVTTSWGSQSSWFTLTMAAGVELPSAVFMYWLAYRANRRSRAAYDARLAQLDHRQSEIHPLGSSESGRAWSSMLQLRPSLQMVGEAQSITSTIYDALARWDYSSCKGPIDPSQWMDRPSAHNPTSWPSYTAHRPARPTCRPGGPRLDETECTGAEPHVGSEVFAQLIGELPADETDALAAAVTSLTHLQGLDEERRNQSSLWHPSSTGEAHS